MDKMGGLVVEGRKERMEGPVEQALLSWSQPSVLETPQSLPDPPFWILLSSYIT